MSLQERAKLAELERRVAALEAAVLVGKPEDRKSVADNVLEAVGIKRKVPNERR